jgi:hypothetical protein
MSMAEKTQIQALDRTQPMLPITFVATEKRTHDYLRHGTTNLFATLNVGAGEVFESSESRLYPSCAGATRCQFKNCRAIHHFADLVLAAVNSNSPTELARSARCLPCAYHFTTEFTKGPNP